SEDLTGNFGGDDWHHPISRQLLHEPLSQTRLYPLQRRHPGAQIVTECRPARPVTGPQRRQAADPGHSAGLTPGRGPSAAEFHGQPADRTIARSRRDGNGRHTRLTKVFSSRGNSPKAYKTDQYLRCQNSILAKQVPPQQFRSRGSRELSSIQRHRFRGVEILNFEVPCEPPPSQYRKREELIRPS